MIKSLIIPSVVVNEEKQPIGWSSIIIVGKKVVDLSGNNDDNFNYSSLLVTAMIEGLGKLKVNSEVTFMLLPKDWRRMCNYKVFESKCSEKVLKDYLDIISFHEIHGKRLPKDFKLPTEREVHEAPETVAESFEEAFEMPPEDEDDGSFYIDDYEEDIQGNSTEEEEEDTTMKNSTPAITIVKNTKEENVMKVAVSYIINGTKSTKEVSLEEAIAFLTRADQRNVPAYYSMNSKNYLNRSAQAMTKKPELKTVSSEAVIPTIDLWVDGACSNNGAENAKAGWGACLVFGDKQKELSGIVDGDQTNNRAEMTAVIEGLKALKKRCKVLIYTDSQVVTRAPAMIERGFKTAAGKPAANKDLLEKLATEFKKHNVTILKVEGHAGVDLNEKCDALARAAVAEANDRVLKNHACVVDEEEQKDIEVINAIKANVANMSIQEIAEELEALDCWTDTEPSRLIDETMKLAFKAHPETKCRMEYEMQKMDEQCCEAYGCHHCEKWVEIVVYDENNEVIAQIPINDL